jgi:hypothetical protein
MARVILAIMVLFMAVGPIAHGYLAYKYNALQSLLPEEETHDEKPQSKAKQYCKDPFLHPLALDTGFTSCNSTTTHLDQLIILSKGYAGIPLMPPDLHS